jgi:putative tricarboxylic transport membrane protein
MNRQTWSDLMLSSFLVLLSGIIYWVIIPWQISVPPQVRSPYLSPAFAPRVFVIFLALTGVALMITTLIRWAGQRSGKTEPEVKSAADSGGVGKGRALIFGTWLVCCLYAFAVKWLGIIPPSILMIGGLMFYFGHKNRVRVVLLAVVVPVVVYLFFTRLANVPFPQGLLFK